MASRGSQRPGISGLKLRNRRWRDDPKNLIGLVPAKGGSNEGRKHSFCRSAFFFDSGKMTDFNEKLRRAVVGIAGLGGLGSNVAGALARAGIGRLIIADFDSVEAANLNRQQYFIDQVGRAKLDCMMENLHRINPDVRVDGHDVKLTAENVPSIFAGTSVIAECFDKAEEKQMIVETVLTKMDGPVIVSVSGLAGYGDSNAIRTLRVSPRLVLVGDGQSGIDTQPVLTAARVGIAACHQANAIIELIADELKT